MRVQNGERIRIGEDPWVDIGEIYKLLGNIITTLHEKSIYTLSQATLLDQSTIWHQEWEKVDDSFMEWNEKELWKAYDYKIKVSHAKIKEIEDALFWSKNPTIIVNTPRLWYQAMFINERMEEMQWCLAMEDPFSPKSRIFGYKK